VVWSLSKGGGVKVRKCARCEKPLEGLRSTQRFCSDRCRVEQWVSLQPRRYSKADLLALVDEAVAGQWGPAHAAEMRAWMEENLT
jgi:predicted nucleic acid-binding Zn ribbon protein